MLTARHQNDVNDVAMVSLLLTLNIFTPFSNVSFVDFKQVNIPWEDYMLGYSIATRQENFEHLYQWWQKLLFCEKSQISDRVETWLCPLHFCQFIFSVQKRALVNQERCFLFHFKTSLRSRDNQSLEFQIFKFHDHIKCLSMKQEIYFTE